MTKLRRPDGALATPRELARIGTFTAQLWYEARAAAMTALGVGPDDLVLERVGAGPSPGT